MRFVDEYRAPEQVMQLIEHLRERASHLSTPPNALCGLWKCVAVIPTLSLNSASTSYCRKTLSLSTVRVPGVRTADG